MDFDNYEMDISALDLAIKRDVQLHEEFRMYYVVNGWICCYSFDDGNTETKYFGETPIKAMITCFKDIRNKRGRKS